MELGNIYEVQLISGGVWVTKTCFEEVRTTIRELKDLTRDQILGRSIEFVSLSGSYHLAMLSSIIGLYETTKEQRKKQIETSMMYQMEFQQPYIGMPMQEGIPNA
jgi:hypothetical protein